MSFHRWFAGFFLLILMVVTLFTNSILFSARSFQDNLQKVAPSTGGVLSLAQLEDIKDEVKTLEQQLSPARAQFSELEQQAAELSRAIEERRSAIARQQADLLASIAAIDSRAAGNEFNADAIGRRIERLSNQAELADEARQSLAEARQSLSTILQMQAELDAQARQLALIESDVRIAGEAVSVGERNILGLKGVYGDDFDRIENEARALMASSPFNISGKFAAMHPTFLSTILACSMGALGAILYLFPAYLNPANKVTFVVIVVRLIFGMVTALAFYIVANVLGVSLAGTSGEMGALNPFMVAFLGIIAGIMADEIAAWILERGREILGGGASPPQITIAPNVGPAGAIADPFLQAARDVLPDRAPEPSGGDEPPRGGVQG